MRGTCEYSRTSSYSNRGSSYRGCGTYVYSDSYSNVGTTYGNSDSKPLPHGNVHSHAYGDAYTDSQPYANTVADRYFDAHSHPSADCYPDPYPHPADTHPYVDANAHSEPHSYVDAHAGSNPHSHSQASDCCAGIHADTNPSNSILRYALPDSLGLRG